MSSPQTGSQGVFFSGEAEAVGRRWTGSCGACSAPVEVALASGEQGRCPYCRASLGVVG